MHKVVANLQPPSEMTSPKLHHLVLEHRPGMLQLLVEDTQELGLLGVSEMIEVEVHHPTHAPERRLVRHGAGDASKAEVGTTARIAQSRNLSNCVRTNR